MLPLLFLFWLGRPLKSPPPPPPSPPPPSCRFSFLLAPLCSYYWVVEKKNVDPGGQLESRKKTLLCVRYQLPVGKRERREMLLRILFSFTKLFKVFFDS